MDCALWLNRRKIFRADEIHDNADIASLRGYFLGGSLCEWLRCHGGASFADMLDELSPDDPDLNEKISRIFCGSPCSDVPSVRLDDAAPVLPAANGSACSFPCSRGIFFGTGGKDSFGGSFSGSFGISAGSYRFGSFGSYRFGSFAHEWEWEWAFGSFGRSSFRTGSFGFGSFGYGSFAGGRLPFGLFPRDKYGSFVMFPDEYDRIMYETLKKCPLDRFGYGIHII